MKKEEVKTAEIVTMINAFGIEVDEPMQRNSSVKSREMKPPAPADARGMGKFFD